MRRRLGAAAAVPTWPLLGLVCGASAVTVVLLGTRLTFFNDDWYFLLQRPNLTADSVFAAHNGHLSALAVLVYKGLVGLFGLDAQLPFRLVLAANVAALGILVFLLVSERAGRALGLIAATIVVFLGPAWEDLLWSFQIGLIGSLVTGLGALLAMERDSPRRNAVACLLLVCSISLSDGGIPFVVAAVIAVALRRRPLRLWIPGIPAALFGIWWIAYGSDAPSTVTSSNLEHVPRYVLDSASVGLASVTGLNRGGIASTYRAGHVLLVVAVLAVAVWLLRGGRPSSSWVLVLLGAALTFWVLAGANYIVGREPFASRYQLMDATFLILIASELFRPVRLGAWPTAAVAAAALVALVSNLDTLDFGYRFMRDHSAYVKGDLGALEIARGRAPATFQLVQPIAHDPFLSGVTAERYFRETDAHGSPPFYSPEQLVAAPAAQRQAADSVLAAAYRMLPRPARRPASPRGCRQLAAGAGGAGTEAELRAGGALVTDLGRAPLAIGVRRFGPANLPVSLGSLGPGSTILVPVPGDRAAVLWRLSARGSSPLEVCPAPL